MIRWPMLDVIKVYKLLALRITSSSKGWTLPASNNATTTKDRIRFPSSIWDSQKLWHFIGIKAIQMHLQQPEELLSEHETSEETDLGRSFLLSGCKWAKARPLNLFSALAPWEYRNEPSGFPSNLLQSTHDGYWNLWAIAASIWNHLRQIFNTKNIQNPLQRKISTGLKHKEHHCDQFFLIIDINFTKRGEFGHN